MNLRAFFPKICNLIPPYNYAQKGNSENILSKLAEMSNKMFSSLKKTGYITERQLKCFSYEHRKITNFGKLYFIPKIHKSLHNVPGRPIIRIAVHLQKNALNF